MPKLNGVFNKQRQEVMARLKRSGTLPKSFTDIEKWDADFADEVKPLIELYYEQGTKQLIRQIGASPDLFAVVTPNIRKAVDAASFKFAKSTNETTSMQLNDALAKLRDELTQGITQGDPLPLLTERVNAIFDQATESRASAIAASEASRAMHGGQHIAARDSGAVKRKKWIASSDACEICLGIMENQPAEGIPLDDNFLSGDGPYGDVPYPPAHPHCMCSLEYVLSDEYQEAAEGGE